MRKTVKKSKKNVRQRTAKSLIRTEVRKALNSNAVVEQKRQCLDSGANVSSAGAFINTMTGNVQGLGDLNVRLGDKFMINKFVMAGNITIGDATNIIRLIVVLWNEDSSLNAPTAQQIFDDSSSANMMLYGAFNKDGDNLKGKKFRVIYDKLFTMNATKNIINIKYTKTFPTGQPVGFIASTTNGVGIPYVFIVSDSGAIVHPAYYLNFAITYCDV